MRRRASSVQVASISSRTGSCGCPLSWFCTSSQPRYSRTRVRATSSPSVEGATSTTALRRMRGRSEPVVSSRKRRAVRLGRPALDTAAGGRTAKWNSPSSSTSRGRSGSMCTRAPNTRVPWVRLFVARTSASSFTSTASAVTRLAHAAWCICFRLGRLPRRHALGSGGGIPSVTALLPNSFSSRNHETSVQRRSPCSSAMRSGRVAPTSPITSRVCAFCPIGCELRKTAQTACSTSRLLSPACSSWMVRALASSPSRIAAQSCPRLSVASRVAIPVSSRAASAMPVRSGAGRNTLGPTRGAVSQLSASRSAMANVRRMPRVR